MGKRIISLVLALTMLVGMVPAISTEANATAKKPETNIELVERLVDIAENYKTLYVMGAYGEPLTDSNKKYHINRELTKDYNQQEHVKKAINAASSDTFAFDCVNLIKGVLWGWDGTLSHTHGGAVSGTNGIPDTNADGWIKLCYDRSSDFSEIEIGEVMWHKGHVGVYIGNGKVVESTSDGASKVQISTVDSSGRSSGLSGRGSSWTWTEHGKMPYVEYVDPIVDEVYPAYCAVKVTKSSINVNSQPCEPTTNASSETLEIAKKDAQYQAIGLYKNKWGNLWYKVKLKESSGTGYLYAGDTTYLAHSVNDIEPSGVTAPTSITQGKAWSLTGTVKSTYNKLTGVSVYVHSGNNEQGAKVTGGSVSVSGNSCALKGSTLDNKTEFDKLAAGTYTYIVSASYKYCYATSGKVFETKTDTIPIYQATFTVKKSASCSHSYGEWVTVTAATTTTTGSEKRTCSSCGDVQTRTIPVISQGTASEYEFAWFPAPAMNLTQIAYESYSHGNQNAIDFAPGGSVFAPFTGKITYKDAKWGYVVLQSTDKVYYADGTLDYMTATFMHDEDISNLSVGQIISQGTAFYQAGGMGNGNANAYADHVHMAVHRGHASANSNYGAGNVYAFDALFVNSAKTTSIKNQGKMVSGNTMYNGAPSNWNGLWVNLNNASDVIAKTYRITFDPNGGYLPYAIAINKLNGINVAREAGFLVVYNNSGALVDTNKYGVEVLVDANNQVIGKRDYLSETKQYVPSGGFVLSGQGENGTWVKEIPIGAYVTYDDIQMQAYVYESKETFWTNYKFVKEGKEIGTLPTPLRDGYNFDGWYTGESGGHRITEDDAFGSDLTLYAHWIANCSINGHSYHDTLWINPTFETEGQIEWTCGDCGYTVTDYLPPLKYEGEYEVEIVEAPTLTKPGTAFYTWRGSQTGTPIGVYVDLVHPCANGHTYEGYPYEIPTRNTEGAVMWECSICGDMVSETLPRLHASDYTYCLLLKEPTYEETGLSCYGWASEYGFCDVYVTWPAMKDCCPNGHSFKGSDLKYAPTLDYGGTLWAVCINCGFTLENSLPALDSRYYEYYVITEPTCITGGLAGYGLVFGYNIYEFEVELPPLGDDGHRYIGTMEVVPTFSNTGRMSWYCEYCGYAFTETMPVLNTNDYEIETKQAPTPTKDGVDKYTWHGSQSQMPIGFDVAVEHACKYGHTYSGTVEEDPTEATEGRLAVSCSVCGDSVKVTLPILNTTDYKRTKWPMPTCTEEGLVTYRWNNKDYGIWDFKIVLEPLGEDYIYEVTREPSESATGALTGTCTRCGGTVTETLPGLNKTDYTYTVVKEPTYTETGVAKWTWNVDTYGQIAIETVLEKLEVKLTGIEIKAAPSKTKYEIGEALDTTGLTLLVRYSDGSTKTFTDGFTIGTFDSSTAGEKTVTVSYGGKTASFTVTVEKAEEPKPSAAQLVVGSATATVGSAVELDVSIANNPGFSVLNVAFVYDTQYLTLTEVENQLSSMTMTSDTTVVWDAVENYSEDGKLCTLKFEIAEDAPDGEYEIRVLFISASNEVFEELEMSGVSGTLEIRNILYGDANGDGKISSVDLAMLRKYIASVNPLTGESNIAVKAGADCNGDGKIASVDLAMLRKYLASLNPITGESTVVLGPR